MSQIIAIPENSPALGYFGFSITLNNGAEVDGTTVTVRFTWLQRLSGWYWDLLDNQGVPILLGERMNAGGLFKFPGDVPPGEFSVFGPAEYGQGDLGTNLQLVYFTPAEVLAFQPEPYRMTLGP